MDTLNRKYKLDREPYRPLGTRFVSRRCKSCRKVRNIPEFEAMCGLCSAPRVDPDALRRARVKCGFTQRNLGAEIGVRNTEVWEWENGRARVPAHRIRALHVALEVDDLTEGFAGRGHQAC